MSINFRRNRTQERYEFLLGITSVAELESNKELFKNHVLLREEVNQLSPLLREDTIDFFYSAIVSFSEGIDALYARRFSWATVKLYYSIYYLLRTSMASNGYALLRNKSMYRLKIAVGEKPFNTNGKRYNSTHAGTINHYKDIFNGTDFLLTNKIDDIDVYQWMENIRDIVNYREACFDDPDCLSVWQVFKNALDMGSLSELINRILNDEQYVYCFQEDYAVLAIPIKRMQQTIKDLSDNNLLNMFTDERKQYTDSILKSENRNIDRLIAW